MINLCNNYIFVIINVFLYFLCRMIYLSPMSSHFFLKKELKVLGFTLLTWHPCGYIAHTYEIE
jgi:hypothetical protein